MFIVGDSGLWQLMLGVIVILLVYWAAKWVISIWTGS